MIKMLTLNLNYDNDRYGAWSDREKMLIQTVRECTPDIITLQAAKRDPLQFDGEDQIAQLSKKLPEYLNYSFFPVTPDSSEGMGYLSKGRLLQTDHQYLTYLPGSEDPNHRVVLSEVFDFGDIRLRVINAHLSWVSEQTAINIPEVISFASQFRGYQLLAGDFNTPPDSKLITLFKQAGWVDAWEQLYPEKAGFTFETSHPSMRIDYVWMSQELSRKVIDIEVISAMPVQTGIGLSDHFGLLASFDLG